MRGRGYEPLASFNFERTPGEVWSRYSVFQKAGAARAENDRYCLVLRVPLRGLNGSQVLCRIDCADGAVTELRTVEPNNGTSAIVRYMGDRNYDLAGDFEKGEHSSPLLFQRKARP